MLTKILNIFSKKNYPKKIVDKSNLLSDQTLTSDQTNKVLWKPDDKLYKEYNDYINSLHSYKTLNLQLNDLILKKERFLEQIENPEISSLDKILQNQDILDISDQITILNNKINKIDQKNDILEKWNSYINDAREFLKNNEMDSYITTKDILSSVNIIHLTKKCQDQITYSVKSNENERTILKLLETNIDKNSINTKGNLLNFDSKNSELLLNNSYIRPDTDLYKNNNTYYAYLK